MKKLLLFTLFILSFKTFYSQRILLPSQFQFNQANLNPAYTGTRKELTLSTIINNRPSSSFNNTSYKSFQVDTPLRFYSMGLGLAVEQATIEINELSSFKLAFSYKIRFLEGLLSFGTFVGIDQHKLNFKNQTINSFTDPTLVSTGSTIQPLATIGVFYQNKRLSSGLSVDNLIKNDLSLNALSSESRTSKNYFGFIETKHYLSEKLTFKPSLQIHKTKQIPINIFLSTILDIDNKLWASLGYKLNSEFFASGGVNLNHLVQGFSQPIKIGLAYSMPQKNKVLLNNAFEIFISYSYLKRPNPEKIKNQKRITSPNTFY